MARINVNTSTAEELMKLPAVGPALAQRIVNFRDQNGSFRTKRDLIQVNGVSERVVALIADRISLSSRTTAKTPVRKAVVKEPPTAPTSARAKPAKAPKEAPAQADSKSEPRASSKGKANAKPATSRKKKKSKGSGKKANKARKKSRAANPIHELTSQTGLSDRILKTVLSTVVLRKGFLSDGRPKVAFDGSAFWSELKKRGINTKAIRKQYPTVVHKKNPGKYPLQGTKEYRRVNRALRIHPQAALRSTYWGQFQLSGTLFKKAGYKKINEFVRAQHQSEEQQLADFVKVLSSKQIKKALKNKDWKRFCALYFTEGEPTVSHKEMAKAYTKASASKRKKKG